MNIKRILSGVLAGAMVFSLAACGSGAQSGSGSNAPASSVVTVENPITYLSISYGENFDTTTYIDVFDEGVEGKVTITCTVGIDQVRGTVDASAMHALTAAFNENNMSQFNEKNEYVDGEAAASYYVEFADGTMVSCSFGGQVPAEFVTGFEAVKAAFDKASENMEVYRAQVGYAEDVKAEHKAELEAIFADCGNLVLENNQAMNLPAEDENYAYTTGIEHNDSILATTAVMNMMGTVPHAISLFEVAEGTDTDAMAAALTDEVNWAKWVCVTPSHAVVAEKDNYVLYLLTAAEIYAEMAPALENAGWTILTTVENTDAMAAMPAM